MDIEEQLRHALRREPPSAGFAKQVMAATRRHERPSTRPRWRAAAAVVMLTLLAGAWSARQIERRREGERARDEVMLALHIAGAKVRYAQRQVHEIGSRTSKEPR